MAKISQWQSVLKQRSSNTFPFQFFRNRIEWDIIKHARSLNTYLLQNTLKKYMKSVRRKIPHSCIIVLLIDVERFRAMHRYNGRELTLRCLETYAELVGTGIESDVKLVAYQLHSLKHRRQNDYLAMSLKMLIRTDFRKATTQSSSRRKDTIVAKHDRSVRALKGIFSTPNEVVPFIRLLLRLKLEWT